ncbi:MAG: hypothetical protein ABQ298_08655 [Puniceicoccaceae bacterium]
MQPPLPIFWLLCSSVFLLVHLQAEPPPEIQRQYQALLHILNQADTAYFEEHESLMSDAAYDRMRLQLQQLEHQYPHLKQLPVPESGAHTRERVEHRSPVLSLQKCKSDAELLAFCNALHQPGTQWVIEPKVDGASIVVTYHHGHLTQALTRGDKLSGIDVTEVILASGALPLAIEGLPEHLELRGEAYIPKAHFDAINAERIRSNQSPYRTARNLASGTLMLQDPVEVMRRGLRMLIFEWRNALESGRKSHFNALNQLKDAGFPVVQTLRVASVPEIIAQVNSLEKSRMQLPFDADGWVIKLDCLAKRQHLGNTQQHPHWATARKFPPAPILATVLEIETSVSDRGKVTPIAILEPVEIDGATIQRATLYNEAFAERMGIRPGSKVWLIRAGGAVPEILGLANGDTVPGKNSKHP